ncbi:MAG: FG-GAP repeat domain-containing protein, partial [Planctomycetota bacterium]
MFRRGLLVVAALVVPAATVPALAGEDPLAETLSFRPETTSRVTQLVEPSLTNEKEVEYGDFDEDGDLDVVIANAYSDFGDRRNKLYENVNGHFNEITLSGAIPGFTVTKVSRNVFFRDFDGDEHLDIWVINDSNSHADQIFLASWAGEEFVQFVETSGRIPSGGLTGAACGGWSADFDQDGDWDVYCGNYPNSAQDQLLENNGFGFFTDVTGTHVPTASDYVVDVNGADMNGDGKLDLLISNHGNHNNWIYYNDNNGAAGALGDFKYTGSTQSLGNPIANENSMEAADFDGDLDLDVYWSNASGVTGDRILRNNGNDGSNKATFTSLHILPFSVTDKISRKASVADLNGDGRSDVFVMKEDGWGRPTVLRNTTVNNDISFVDWTPASTFPSTDWHVGWHAALFDTNNDGDVDIFLGGYQGDHLFENCPPLDYEEGALAAGVIPELYNREAAAVIGSVGAGASDTFV